VTECLTEEEREKTIIKILEGPVELNPYPYILMKYLGFEMEKTIKIGSIIPNILVQLNKLKVFSILIAEKSDESIEAKSAFLDNNTDSKKERLIDVLEEYYKIKGKSALAKIQMHFYVVKLLSSICRSSYQAMLETRRLAFLKDIYTPLMETSTPYLFKMAYLKLMTRLYMYHIEDLPIVNFQTEEIRIHFEDFITDDLKSFMAHSTCFLEGYENGTYVMRKQRH
jgi:hypothetical protein